MSPKTLGDRIKVKRYELGLSIVDISAKMGVSAALVRDWEKDRVQPEENAWKALDGLLGLGKKAFQVENPA